MGRLPSMVSMLCAFFDRYTILKIKAMINQVMTNGFNRQPKYRKNFGFNPTGLNQVGNYPGITVEKNWFLQITQ
jgi:hypothetical protein